MEDSNTEGHRANDRQKNRTDDRKTSRKYKKMWWKNARQNLHNFDNNSEIKSIFLRKLNMYTM